MKQLLLISMLLLSCINCLSEETTILIKRSCLEDLEKDKRSVVIIPTATIDGNTIRIYSDISVNNLTLEIKDNGDNVVYSNTSISNSKCHTFELSALP